MPIKRAPRCSRVDFVVYDCNQTIAAIASAPGGAARGIIRLSGPLVFEILKSCARVDPVHGHWSAETPAVHGGTMTVGTARAIDLPLDIYLWPGKRSYTREPLAEIHTLGSPPLVSLALAAFCAVGARLAEPGEFTLRAFLAGRIDLPQAEAVIGIIDARDPLQYQQALAQLAGGLAQPLGTVRDQLLDLLADLEAGLDFVEDDIRFITNVEVARRLSESVAFVDQLAVKLSARRDHDELPRVVLIGRENAGKSSLFNALAEGAEALVSDVPGTTRDYLCATLIDNGVRWQLVDTAGLGSCRPINSLEVAADQSTQLQVAHCDLRVLCIDASRPTDAWDVAQQAANPSAGLVVVFTKCDARRDPLPFAGIETSALAHTGLDELRRTLAHRVVQIDRTEFALSMTAARCGESLRAVAEALACAFELNQRDAGEELVAAEIRLALDALGKVVGTVYTEDVLDRVFRRFCIGK